MLSGVTVTWKVIEACAVAFFDPLPAKPEMERFVRRPVTAEGLTSRAIPLPLDTWRVVLREVVGTPVPSRPPMSVHAVVFEAKLKLPLLWARAAEAPNC